MSSSDKRLAMVCMIPFQSLAREPAGGKAPIDRTVCAFAIRPVAADAWQQADLGPTLPIDPLPGRGERRVAAAGVDRAGLEVRRNVRDVLVRKRGNHAGHHRVDSSACLEIAQLLGNVVGSLAGEIREQGNQRVTVRAVAGAANRGLGRARRGIADELRGLGGQLFELGRGDFGGRSTRRERFARRCRRFVG